MLTSITMAMCSKYIIVEGQSSVLHVGAKVCTDTKKNGHQQARAYTSQWSRISWKQSKETNAQQNGFDFTILDCNMNNLNHTSGW